MSELPAGRELDVLVAERVMKQGESVLLLKGTKLWMFPYVDIIHRDEWYLESSIKTGGYYTDPRLNDKFAHGEQRILRDHLVATPAYSTDIAAAWSVVEKLDPALRVTVARTASGEYWCSITHHGGGADETRVSAAYADTAPLAICRAALKAVSTK